MPLTTAGLIVCGPMLRRVDRQGFSVFLVLKEPRNVQLVLHDGTAASSSALEPPVAFTAARQLGANFYALVVTHQHAAGLQPARSTVTTLGSKTRQRAKSTISPRSGCLAARSR